MFQNKKSNEKNNLNKDTNNHLNNNINNNNPSNSNYYSDNIKNLNNFDKYFKDIEIIKELLLKKGEKPIISHWIFIIWGIIILLATILNYYLYLNINIQFQTSINYIWIPSILVAIMIEIFGWIKNLEKQEIPLTSKITFHYLYFAITTSIFIIIFLKILYLLNGVKYFSIVILFSMGLFSNFIGLMSYNFFYIISSILYSLGIIFYFIEIWLHVKTDILLFVTGIIISIMFVITGMLFKKKLNYKNL